MKKGVKKYVFTAVVSVLVTLVVVCFVLNIDPTRLTSQIPLIRKLTQIDMYAGHCYIEDYEIETAADYAAAGFVGSLGDNYAGYYSAQNYAEKEEITAGKRLGIGVTIAKNPDSGDTVIIYVNRESSAGKAGVQKGDILMKCDGKSVVDKSLDEITEYISSEEEKQTVITVKRGEKTLNFNVEYADFIADSVNWRVYDGCGIINITVFDDTTKSQFDSAIEDLQKQKVSGYIIDLRNNGGGTVDSCTDILDELLPKGDICRVKYKSGSIKVLAKSDSKMDDTPLCVLVNGNSASASEIFANAVRDFDRGVIIGEKTFGKGIMQTTYTLTDKSAVKFTTAYVVDKNGETYHEKGIEPDIKVTLPDEINERYYFMTDDEDTQLQAAVDYLAKSTK